MKLDISKRFLKAGDIIEISWNSEGANDPRLILNTGDRQSTLSVPETGSKKFRLKCSRFHQSIKLMGNVNGKEKNLTQHIFVYGKRKETDEFEYIDRGDASLMNRWNQTVKNWWRSFNPEKKKLYILLLWLLGYHLIKSIPATAPYADIIFYVTIVWLFWQIVKK